MNCPLCSATAADGAAECPSCGVFFAKLRERREREKMEAAAAYALTEAPAPALTFNQWRVRLAAAAVVAAWLIGFGLYCLSRMEKIPRQRRPLAHDSPSSALLRDPATGKLNSVEVHISPTSSRHEPPPRPADEPAPPATGGPAYDSDFDD